MKIFAILLVLVMINGCAKTADIATCTTANTATLTVFNSSSNPYMVAVNGSDIGSVSGKGNTKFTIQASGISLKATQLSGYLIYPTVVNNSVLAVECHTYTWNIP